MKSSAALVLLMAALSAIPSSAMPLGLRLIATPKSKWDAATRTPDDYVQDGLIAMWDGEWNAGRGVHDDAATIWKDLIGSRDLTMLDMTTSSRCWEKNCAYTDYGNLTRYSSTAIAEARAIECVYMPTKYGASYAGTLVMNNGVNTSTEAQGYVVNILTRFHSSKGVDGLQVAYDKFAYFGTKSVFNTIYTYTAQYSTVYRNAVGFEVQTMSGDGWSGSTISIASRNGQATFNSPGRFYCVRIYNRELTAEEAAHNYAVDKARFGTTL